jgi:GT2 family glycosyltransferase
MKITLWMPCADSSARWPVINSVWNLETPDNIKLRLVRSNANNPKYSWNKVVKDFLDTTTDDWLLSWHSDVVGAPQTLARLLSWDQPLISALIFMRTSPVMPHIWRHYDETPNAYSQRIRDTRKWFYAHPEFGKEFGPFVMDPRPGDALVPADFTSTSCMLIHRDVLQAMRQEVNDVWFRWDDDYNGGGEDRNFCQNAAKAGFTTFVDRSCVVGHLAGDIPTSSADFLVWDSVSNVLGAEPHEIIR